MPYNATRTKTTFIVQTNHSQINNKTLTEKREQTIYVLNSAKHIVCTRHLSCGKKNQYQYRAESLHIKLVTKYPLKKFGQQSIKIIEQTHQQVTTTTYLSVGLWPPVLPLRPLRATAVNNQPASGCYYPQR